MGQPLKRASLHPYGCEEFATIAALATATSCIEAGVDVSFDIALRERSSVASLIQIGGRVNRNGESAGGEVWDFAVNDAALLTNNPSVGLSVNTVQDAFANGWLDRFASDAMTAAIAAEAKRDPRLKDQVQVLENAEPNWEFVEVAKLSRLIKEDTVTAFFNSLTLECVLPFT